MPGNKIRVMSAITVGLLVIAGSVQAQEDVAPPAEFSGVIPCNFTAEDAGNVSETVVGTSDGGDLTLRQTRGQASRLTDMQSDDPRFTGTYSVSSDLDAYYGPGQQPADAPTLVTRTPRIETQDGAWQGTVTSGTWSGDPTVDGWSGVIALYGEDAYAGMTALWTERYSDELCEWEFKGVVIDGEPPATAE